MELRFYKKFDMINTRYYFKGVVFPWIQESY